MLRISHTVLDTRCWMLQHYDTQRISPSLSAHAQVSLSAHDPEAVRGVLTWMCAPTGAPKREAAGTVLSPELVVETARFTHYLDVPELLQPALTIIGRALDVDNAPSCLLLARELDDIALAQKVRAAAHSFRPRSCHLVCSNRLDKRVEPVCMVVPR